MWFKRFFIINVWLLVLIFLNANITNATGSWVVETIDNIGAVVMETSLAIDSQDKVHISYCDTANQDLKYITNATGSWLVETLDSIGDVGEVVSLAVDSQDKVHISYSGWAYPYIKYITNATGSWVVETVDHNSGDLVSDISLAVDSQDRVHISCVTYFVGWGPGYEIYITNVTGSWVIETLDSLGSEGMYTSLAVDSQDKVHISYDNYYHVTWP